MRRFLAATTAFVLLGLILWFFHGLGAAIFIVIAMVALGLAFHYLPGYRVTFAFLIIGSILAIIVIPMTRHFIAREFPQFRVANDRSILELDHKLAKLTDPSMVYSKTAMRSYLGSLDSVLKRQLDQQLETLLQKKENGTFGTLEAVELGQIIHRINVWGMIYEANQEALDKGKIPPNMLTVSVRVGPYDVPLYTGIGQEMQIVNGNSDQVSNGKIRAGSVVRIVIPEMVRQFAGQPETNPLQKWVVSQHLIRKFQLGEVFAIVYLDDVNGLPTVDDSRCGWLPLSAFETVVNPYKAPKRSVQNDLSGGWQDKTKNFFSAGEKIRWSAFLLTTGLMLLGYWVAGRWLRARHPNWATACRAAAIILIFMAAWSYIASPMVQALMTNNDNSYSGRKSVPSPASVAASAAPTTVIPEKSNPGEAAKEKLEAVKEKLVVSNSTGNTTMVSFVGQASHYGGPDDTTVWPGKKTTSGEPFDPHGVTAAHRNLPFNTVVEVVNLDDQTKSVRVRINDRGPNDRLDEREIDLTPAAFACLAPVRNGLVLAVKVTVLNFGNGQARAETINIFRANDQSEHGGQVIKTSSQELASGLVIPVSGGEKIYWHRYGWVRWWIDKWQAWSCLLPQGEYFIEGQRGGRVAAFDLSNPKDYPNLPDCCVVAKLTDNVGRETIAPWPAEEFGLGIKESEVPIGVLLVPVGTTKLTLTLNKPHDTNLSMRWMSDQGSIILEVVK